MKNKLQNISKMLVKISLDNFIILFTQPKKCPANSYEGHSGVREHGGP